MTARRPKATKPPRRRVSATRAAVRAPPNPCRERTSEVCLIALALGLLALIAGAEVVPVVLLVALALGVWRPRA
jgi:hypothetical protein